MEIKQIMKVATILLLTISMGFTESVKNKPFKSGDLLFRGRMQGSLSQAIDAVTQTAKEHHFTHMGIVEVLNDTVWVYHAAPEKGVCKELLADFSLNEEDSVVLGHFRIKESNSEMINRALGIAKQYVGQPYNYTYIMKDEGFYCSEYVYQLFKQDSIFKLNPMTFIDPSSGEYHSAWIEHYHDLGIDIPEGLPGCNPNGMAANERLDFLGLVE